MSYYRIKIKINVPAANRGGNDGIGLEDETIKA